MSRILVFCLFLIYSVFADLNCPTNWSLSKSNGQCYYYSGLNTLSFSEAASSCNNVNGGNLVSILDQTEYDFVSNLIGTSPYLTWIGLSTDDVGEYFWTDGSVFNYSLSGLSNDPNRCFALRTNVQINNFVELHGSQAQPFICKQQASFCPASSYTNAFGKLTSSNYPGNYENNLDCKYSIVVAPGNRVEFNLRYFQSEPTYDYLSVIDGPDVDGVLLSTYSGDLGVDIENYQIISSSNSLTLVFFSDFAHNFKGWTADYQSLPMDKTQIINGISGVLSSPNFPKNYPAFAEELYVITSPVNTRINFVVDTVWLAQHYASISFYDGPSQSYPKLNKFMGHLVDSGMTSINFKSTQNVVTVYFLSEDLIADKGWHFSWSAEYF